VLSIPGHAQEAPQGAEASGGLSEIVVTAQRRSENLQRVPIAVTAVSGEQIDAAAIKTTQDLPALVPGLTFPSDFDYALPHIRGVGNTAVAPGAENSVALYVDGVYYAAAIGSILSLNNVAQLEVLKGPQGTLFGRNATGGLIQIITKEPSATPQFEAEVGYGNYQTATLDAYATGGLTDHLAADVAIQYSHQGQGYGRNEFNGMDIYQLMHNLSARSKVLWTPTDGTRLTLSVDYEDQKNSIPVTQAQGTAYTNPFYPPETISQPPYDANINIQPLDTNKGGGASLKFEQDVGFADLLNILAWRRSVSYYGVDFDLGPEQLISTVVNQFDEQISEELQLRSRGSGPFTWTTGLYYYHGKNGYDPQIVGFGGFVAPVIGPGLTLTATPIWATQTTNSIAGYAQGTYAIAPTYNLTVGVRFTHEKRDFDAREDGILNDTIPINIVPQFSKSLSVNRPTWRLAFDHNFTDDLMGYVSYNRGFKSGGFNPGDPTGTPYKTEQLDAYEVGLKSQMLDRRLRINGAAFYYNYNDIQVSRFVNGSPLVYNGAKAKLYGADVDLTAALTDHLQLDAGFEAMHSEFTEFPCADFFAGGPNVSDSACSASPAPALPYLRSAKGNQLPIAPNFTSSITLSYHTSMFGGTGNFAITDAYNSGFYYEPNNEANVKQSSYNLLNGSITWTSRSEHFHVQLWALNLTDTRYTVELASAPTGVAETFAQPRTYGVTVGTKF
jgi:iron complex outermembrane receptor protein